MKTILTTLSLFIISSFLNAQPGTLDKSFGNNGISTTLMYSPNETFVMAQRMAQLADGGFIVAASSGTTNSSQVYLYKLNNNGTINSSFGTGGRVRIFADKLVSFIYALAIDAQGRIVVTTSYGQVSTHSFTIARFTAAGAPDSSFSGDGVTEFINNNYIVTPEEDALSILPNGKIVAGAILRNNNTLTFSGMLIQFTANGALDKSFGGKGYVVYNSATTGTHFGNQYMNSMPLVIQADGKIVFTYIDIVRYNANGTRDMSFGTNGKITPLQQDGYTETLHDVNALPDGRLMACGALETNKTINHNVYRYTKDGVPDASFGTNGTVNLYYGAVSSYPAAFGLLTIQPDNKFLLSFIKNINTARNEFIIRYLPDGTVDSSFANNGSIPVSTMSYSTFITSDMLLEHDNKIVTLAYSPDYVTNDSGYFYMFRYLNDVNTLNSKQQYAQLSVAKQNVTITLVPNPAVGNVIVSGLQSGKHSEITVTNFAGNTLSKQYTTSAQYSLNVSKLTPGIYYVVITQDGVVIDKKQFMKQ